MDRLAPERPGRPPTIQSETMNVMWIERGSPHDRSQLAPHSHDDFEEGAIVVDGHYIQHLRTPWTADARQWRDDEHRNCGPGTITIVPPTGIHTTEAIDEGRHIMLNIFSPVRADQIKSGLVLNSNEYKVATHVEAATT
jgi:quercetin dioxygenase-like cupin family protein